MYNINKINFKPLPLLSSGKLQTILGSFGIPPKAPPSEKIIVDLPDGDQLICSVSTPENPNGIVILIHGLGGSENSGYMLRMSKKLYAEGLITVRVNLRGCGPGEGLARLPHCAACSGDLQQILEKSHAINLNLPIQMVGFSMGGHLLLKFLGDQGGNVPPYLIQGIAICPAVDPADTVRLFALPENQIFENYYIKDLVKVAHKTEELFPEFGKTNFPSNPSMYQYDEVFTAPRWKFETPDQYYEESRSSKVIHNIKIPCKIFYSLDDPIVSCHTIEAIDAPSNVTLCRSEFGGHMGFLGLAGEGFGIRFMDKQLMEWIKKTAVREDCGQGGI